MTVKDEKPTASSSEPEPVLTVEAEPNIPVAVAEEAPEDAGLPATVEITAPSDLPAGYVLAVENDGKRMLVTVVCSPMFRFLVNTNVFSSTLSCDIFSRSIRFSHNKSFFASYFSILCPKIRLKARSSRERTGLYRDPPSRAHRCGSDQPRYAN